ncbi:hypothetical protein BH11PLA2_BH11PLA2_46380 [soil metagenome]
MKYQSKLWPELVQAGVLPKPGAADFESMAERFRVTFETNQWVSPGLIPQRTWKLLGTAYLRYSDDNSNPRSLDQQLVNVLEKAKQTGIFIPWSFVFADAAITGTIAARHGYQLAKRLIQDNDANVDVLLIDEIGRASRDAIEALHLGRMIEMSKKRMIGATDGFDSANQISKLQLDLYDMLHELFVDQLREKDRRGMRDAFGEGKNIFPPAVGYKLVEVRDINENYVVDDDGRVVKERVIDEQWTVSMQDAYRWFADESWSRDRIARVFNERAVGGCTKWDSSRIGVLLGREIHKGVEYYEKT